MRQTIHDKIDQVIADYESGMGTWSIAKKYGVSGTCVQIQLKKHGVKMRMHGTNGEQRQKVIQMKIQGYKNKEVAGELGLSDSQVSKIWNGYKKLEEHEKDMFFDSFIFADHTDEKRITTYTDKKTGKVYRDITKLFLHSNEIVVRRHR